MSSTQSTEQRPAGVDTATLLRGAGVVSLVLAVLSPVVGLVTSVATRIWAARSGAGTRLATWGIVVSVVLIVATVVVAVIAFSLVGRAANDGLVDVQALCAHRDSWGWLIDSLRYVCR